MSSLDRIEKRISALTKPKVQDKGIGDVDGDYGTNNPIQLFTMAMDEGNYPIAAEALKRYMKIATKPDVVLDMATLLLEKYDTSGEEIAKEIIEKHFDDLKPEYISAACFAMYSLARVAMRLENEKEYIANVVNKTLKKDNVSKIDQARLINVLASIEWSLMNDYEAIKFQKETIELAPDEPVYHYNLAKVYESVNNDTEMFKCIEKLLELHRDPNLSHPYLQGLEWAKSIYEKHSKPNVEIDDIKKLIDKFLQSEINTIGSDT
jgi:tetratricopeptide (TPR) repeat protein